MIAVGPRHVRRVAVECALAQTRGVQPCQRAEHTSGHVATSWCVVWVVWWVVCVRDGA